jgi:serine/threonine-protein kinase
LGVTSSDSGTLLPATVGRYRIEGELGRGMMGVVYKAHDPLMDRRVALKVVRLAFPVDDPQRAAFDARFLAEARIVARLSHPNIVVAYDVGRDGPAGPPFIALEYLQGRTLAQTLADARPDWRVTLRLVVKLAEALHYAHEQGVVHRDVKPANVMLLSNGEPKLMDFGLARVRAGLEGAASAPLVGTPLYMAPEQALGREADARSDLFSLGSLTYTLLTGRRAFEAESVPRILQRVAFDEPPRPTRVQRDLPASLDYVLARALAKDPAARYPDGRTLAEDCEDVLHLRPPRHRSRWTPAPTPLGDNTLASPTTAGRGPNAGSVDSAGAGSLTAESPLPTAVPTPAPTPPARRRASRLPLTLLGFGMLATGAGLFASVTWRQALAGWLGVAPAPPAARLPALVPSIAPSEPTPDVERPVAGIESPVADRGDVSPQPSMGASPESSDAPPLAPTADPGPSSSPGVPFGAAAQPESSPVAAADRAPSPSAPPAGASPSLLEGASAAPAARPSPTPPAAHATAMPSPQPTGSAKPEPTPTPTAKPKTQPSAHAVKPSPKPPVP